MSSKLIGVILDNSLLNDTASIWISLLRLDTTLVKFVHPESDGRFEISGIASGRYLLEVLAPGRLPMLKRVSIPQEEVFDIGRLALEARVDSLPAAVVKSEAIRLRMRGDSLEFDPAQLKLEVNASVGDLLARIPGLQIDRAGNITFNGEKVDKLMVDGEEVTTGKPDLLIRLMEAGKIRKVQLYDKKTKRADFTGVDDGIRIKTLNLVVKDEAGHSLETRGEAAGGTGGRYDSKALSTAFRPRNKTILFGYSTDVSASDAGNDDVTVKPPAGIPQDALGAIAGPGIPRITGVGGHRATTLRSADEELRVDGGTSWLNNNARTTVDAVQSVAGGQYGQNENLSSVNAGRAATAQIGMVRKRDTVSALDVSLTGSVGQGQNSLAGVESSSINNAVVNGERNKITDRTGGGSLTGAVMWRRRLSGRRQTMLSATLDFSGNYSQTNGYQSSESYTYSAGQTVPMDTIDQRKFSRTSTGTINAGVNLSRNLSHGLTGVMGFEADFTGDWSSQGAFAKNGEKYDLQIDSLTTFYSDRQTKQIIKGQISGKWGRFSFSAGTELVFFRLQSPTSAAAPIRSYGYSNTRPRLNAEYRAGKSSIATVQYVVNNQFPTADMLNPAIKSADPLHITKGTPSLHPSVSHQGIVTFTRVGRIGVNARMVVDLNTNAISTKVSTDTLGRQVTQPANVPGRVSGWLHSGLNFRTLGGQTGIFVDLSRNRAYNYIGSQLNTNHNGSSAMGVSWGTARVGKFSTGMRLSGSRLETRTSLDPALSTGYWSFNGSWDNRIFFGKVCQLWTTVDYTWNERTPVFNQNRAVTMLSAGVTRDIFRGATGLELSANNILDQDAGVSRSISLNTVSQVTSVVLRRYFMLKVKFRFPSHR